MNILIYVGIGGILGSISRYKIERLISSRLNSLFPFATLIINLIGSFLLGIISYKYNATSIYSLIGDGFLGSFTTYSTFIYGSMILFRKNENKYALLYILTSVILGAILFIAGFSISHII